MQLPNDYLERVYAGVIGKLVGVYLGRPFEGWTYRKIMEELGPIEYYVHERLNQPLVVTDDDVAGTFTFIRALEDYGVKPNLAAEEIGKAWLNYIVEERSILWWGGNGNSTEHTAWLNLKKGRCGASFGVDCHQRPGSRRADRRADLHRRLGHGRAAPARTCGQTCRTSRQSQS